MLLPRPPNGCLTILAFFQRAIFSIIPQGCQLALDSGLPVVVPVRFFAEGQIFVVVGSFTQHITCSTVTGIVLGGIAYHTGFSIPTCLLTGGLCSVAGMLPDIDSDTSRSFQECIYLAAGLATILWVHRLLQFNLSQDIIVLNGAGMFLFVRFAIGGFVKRSTVHRGMVHSIPAAVLSGEMLFFISAGTTPERLLKAFAITLGYLSHLALDEYFSIDHGTGVVIGQTSIIGNHVRLYQGVTLGAKSFSLDEEGNPVDTPRHPILEDRVTVYSNATILGRITIGKGTVVGGNIWLTHSVPPNSKILQSKAVESYFSDGLGI